MSHILHRQLARTYPVAVSGRGVHVFDRDGKAYIDGSGGAAVSCLGHGHPDVIAAMKTQLDALEYVHTSFFTTEVAEQLADALIAKAPAGVSHAFFVAGGSEAVESCLKIARQYVVETGQMKRSRFISRRQSYHGATLGAMSVGGNLARRPTYEPMLFEGHFIEPCYPYRLQRPDESDEAYGARAAQALEDKLLELGPDTVIGFVAETVVGSTLGAVPPAPGYFKRIREICDHYGVLLILDEVMCGMGRTGTLFACEQDGVAPDLIAIAKGMGGGYAPIGAALVGQKIHDAIAAGSGGILHNHTYIGHAVACAAALAVQRVIVRDNLLANVGARGEQLSRRLKERFGNHPFVGEVRGRGLMQGLEIVADRGTKAPFDASAKVHARIKAAAMARGLMVYPMGGVVDGRAGDNVLIAPPFIVDPETIDTIVERLGESVDAALTGVA